MRTTDRLSIGKNKINDHKIHLDPYDPATEILDTDEDVLMEHYNNNKYRVKPIYIYPASKMMMSIKKSGDGIR